VPSGASQATPGPHQHGFLVALESANESG